MLPFKTPQQFSIHLKQEYRTSSFHNTGMHIYLKFETYNIIKKTWFMKALIFMPRMLKLTSV